MISKPRTALGGGLLVAVLLVSGCNARVGAAATVGGTRITTDTLDAAYRDAASSSAGKAEGAKLQSDILTQLVQLQEYREVARREHVTVSQGDIDSAYTQVVSASSDSPQSAATYKREAELVATQTAIGIALADRGGKVDSVRLYGVPVKDDATAKVLLGKLKADLGNAAALAQQYTTIKSVGDVGGQLGNVSLGDNNAVPQAATAKVNVPFIADIESQTAGQPSTIAVFMVTARLDRAGITDTLKQYAKVTVNPRFGTWGETTDPTTNTTSLGVVALASDVVIPNPQASAAAPAATAAPAASLAPGASAPPVATAAPGSGVPATVGPAPTAAPEPTTAPQPTAVPAPTATPAPTSVAPSAAPSS